MIWCMPGVPPLLPSARPAASAAGHFDPGSRPLQAALYAFSVGYAAGCDVSTPNADVSDSRITAFVIPFAALAIFACNSASCLSRFVTTR